MVEKENKSKGLLRDADFLYVTGRVAKALNDYHAANPLLKSGEV